MRRIATWAIAVASLVGAAPAAAQQGNALEQLEQAICDAVERARPSVAQVVVRRTLELESGAGAVRDQVSMSGIVWSADGHIVGLGRIFESVDAVEVVLSSGESRPAELVGTDDDTGIALLKISPEGLGRPLRPAVLGSAKALRPGAFVISVSSPFGLAGSAAVGNVSGVKRVVRRGNMALADVLQITTPVNPGDPGGLLANSRGEVVGVIASTYDRGAWPEGLAKLYREISELARRFGGGRERRGHGDAAEEARFAGGASPFGAHGIGFALPVEHAREAVERIKAAPRARGAWLGVQVARLDARSIGAGGEEEGEVAIVGVKEGSPAHRAGLRQNDVLLRFAGRPVGSLRDLRGLVAGTPAGTAVEIEVLRDGHRISVRAVLERRRD